MGYISIEKLMKTKKESLYKLVLTAASRANELAQGAQPQIKSDSKKVSTVSLEEIAAGKTYYELNEKENTQKSEK